MTPQDLASAASLLYGSRWQRQLAKALPVNDRLVRRWSAGERPIPSWVSSRLIELLEERKEQISVAVLLLSFNLKETILAKERF